MQEKNGGVNSEIILMAAIDLVIEIKHIVCGNARDEKILRLRDFRFSVLQLYTEVVGTM